MPEQEKPQRKNEPGQQRDADRAAENANTEDTADELSIEELETAAGGTGTYPPDPNAGC